MEAVARIEGVDGGVVVVSDLRVTSLERGGYSRVRYGVDARGPVLVEDLEQAALDDSARLRAFRGAVAVRAEAWASSAESADGAAAGRALSCAGAPVWVRRAPPGALLRDVLEALFDGGGTLAPPFAAALTLATLEAHRALSRARRVRMRARALDELVWLGVNGALVRRSAVHGPPGGACMRDGLWSPPPRVGARPLAALSEGDLVDALFSDDDVEDNVAADEVVYGAGALLHMMLIGAHPYLERERWRPLWSLATTFSAAEQGATELALDAMRDLMREERLLSPEGAPLRGTPAWELALSATDPDPGLRPTAHAMDSVLAAVVAEASAAAHAAERAALIARVMPARHQRLRALIDDLPRLFSAPGAAPTIPATPLDAQVAALAHHARALP